MSMDGTPIIIKRKKAHAHPHHGGSWKVAYADFVTAMMAFFMVLWIMGLSDQTRSQISGYFNDPLGYSRTQPLSRNIIPFHGMQTPKAGSSKSQGNEQVASEETKIQAVGEKIKDAVGKDSADKNAGQHIDVAMGVDGLRVELVEDPASIFFESGSAVIKPEGKRIIMKAIAPVLATSQREMWLEGHTDSMPYPSSSYDNFDLSSERALSLKRELINDGVLGTQVKRIEGMADTKLKIPSDPYSAKNRRVVILLPFHQFDDAKVDIKGDELKAKIREKLKPETAIGPKAPDIAPN